MYENKELCSQCKGRCCKRQPGACFPIDFSLPGDLSKLREALASGKYTIDWWEGDPRKNKDELDKAYFVRPSIKGKEGERYDPTWGGECTFLTKKGCSLETEKRPLNCKMLEPREDHQCFIHGNKNKHAAAIAWLPYFNELDREE